MAGDHGAHGSFDATASTRSVQFSPWKRRRWLGLAGAAIATALAAAAVGTRRERCGGNLDASDSAEYSVAARRFSR